MTPEEINALDALVKAATPGEWRVELARTVLWIRSALRDIVGLSVSPPRVPEREIRDEHVRRAKADAAAIAALHNAAPALIAAARDAERLRATVDAQTAIIVDLKAEKAGLELDVERLRAFVPVWRREDKHTLHLTVGPVALGGVMGPHPVTGAWGAMVMDEDAPTEHPDLPTAAAAVCARLKIPSVEVPNG